MLDIIKIVSDIKKFKDTHFNLNFIILDLCLNFILMQVLAVKKFFFSLFNSYVECQKCKNYTLTKIMQCTYLLSILNKKNLYSECINGNKVLKKISNILCILCSFSY